MIQKLRAFIVKNNQEVRVHSQLKTFLIPIQNIKKQLNMFIKKS